ncbi:MAG: NAD(+)/NADH kinase [Synergistaceae bacterium]|nr:NAD(+)/NADH kinase [Synergistaceae bacterium]
MQNNIYLQNGDNMKTNFLPKNKNIGLLFNCDNKNCLSFAQELIFWGKEKGYNFLLREEEAECLGMPYTDKDQWIKKISFCVVLGGDGAMVRASHTVYRYDIPLLGVNFGHLGFLALCNGSDCRAMIETIFAGQAFCLKRRLLRVKVWRNGGIVKTFRALNDAVISSSLISRIGHFILEVGGKRFVAFLADGIICSTPTGSTAYNLSAGGPIVPPHAPLMVMTPICAHTLNARSVVFSEGDNIVVIPTIKGGKHVLTVDGQIAYNLKLGDKIEIELDPKYIISTFALQDENYFAIIQEKLGFGKR